jgi:hypothetical protein
MESTRPAPVPIVPGEQYLSRFVGGMKPDYTEARKEALRTGKPFHRKMQLEIPLSRMQEVVDGMRGVPIDISHQKKYRGIGTVETAAATGANILIQTQAAAGSVMDEAKRTPGNANAYAIWQFDDKTPVSRAAHQMVNDELLTEVSLDSLEYFHEGDIEPYKIQPIALAVCFKGARAGSKTTRLNDILANLNVRRTKACAGSSSNSQRKCLCHLTKYYMAEAKGPAAVTTTTTTAMGQPAAGGAPVNSNGSNPGPSDAAMAAAQQQQAAAMAAAQQQQAAAMAAVQQQQAAAMAAAQHQQQQAAAAMAAHVPKVVRTQAGETGQPSGSSASSGAGAPQPGAGGMPAASLLASAGAMGAGVTTGGPGIAAHLAPEQHPQFNHQNPPARGSGQPLFEVPNGDLNWGYPAGMVPPRMSPTEAFQHSFSGNPEFAFPFGRPANPSFNAAQNNPQMLQALQLQQQQQRLYQAQFGGGNGGVIPPGMTQFYPQYMPQQHPAMQGQMPQSQSSAPTAFPQRPMAPMYQPGMPMPMPLAGGQQHQPMDASMNGAPEQTDLQRENERLQRENEQLRQGERQLVELNNSAMKNFLKENGYRSDPDSVKVFAKMVSDEASRNPDMREWMEKHSKPTGTKLGGGGATKQPYDGHGRYGGKSAPAQKQPPRGIMDAFRSFVGSISNGGKGGTGSSGSSSTTTAHTQATNRRPKSQQMALKRRVAATKSWHSGGMEYDEKRAGQADEDGGSIEMSGPDFQELEQNSRKRVTKFFTEHDRSERLANRADDARRAQFEAERQKRQAEENKTFYVVPEDGKVVMCRVQGARGANGTKFPDNEYAYAFWLMAQKARQELDYSYDFHKGERELAKRKGIDVNRIKVIPADLQRRIQADEDVLSAAAAVAPSDD